MPQRRFITAPIDTKGLTEEGEFSGYLSRWGEEDSYGDVFEKGAFKESLKASTRFPVPGRRSLLWQHDTTKPIGVLQAKEDSEGLWIDASINLEVQQGKEAYSLIKQGAVTGLSHGFDPVEWKQRKSTAGQSGRSYKKAALWEGSPVTFPALPTAMISQVRSMGASLEARSVDEEVALELTAWLKARREGPTSDAGRDASGATGTSVDELAAAVLKRLAIA